MSDAKIIDKGVVIPVDGEVPHPLVNRRNAVAAVLLGGLASGAKALEMSCLPAPDCDAVCEEGGVPRGDGTQVCDCNPPDTCVNPDKLASVAYTGNYKDLVNKPEIKSDLKDVVVAGSAGPTSDVTMTQVDSASGLQKPPVTKVTIPYFKVDSKGRVTAYGNKTLTLETTYYNNYSNYYAYGNYYAYTNYSAYQNYSAYGNYRNYYDYYDSACCGDSDAR